MSEQPARKMLLYLICMCEYYLLMAFDLCEHVQINCLQTFTIHSRMRT